MCITEKQQLSTRGEKTDVRRIGTENERRFAVYAERVDARKCLERASVSLADHSELVPTSKRIAAVIFEE
jgi:hypothetical protein